MRHFPLRGRVEHWRCLLLRREGSSEPGDEQGDDDESSHGQPKNALGAINLGLLFGGERAMRIGGGPDDSRGLFSFGNRGVVDDDAEAAQTAFIAAENDASGHSGEVGEAGLAIASDVGGLSRLIGVQPFVNIAQKVVKAVSVGLGSGGGLGFSVAVFDGPDLDGQFGGVDAS